MCPRILHICGPLWVNGYGLMIALGFLFFTVLTFRHPWRKRLLADEKYLNVLFVGFLSAIAGGRLLFVITDYSSFDSFGEIFLPWVGGFSLFGSVIFVLIAVSLYLYWIGVKILPFFDLIGLHAPLLIGISRLGCFMAGCCYGLPSSSCCSVTFTDPHGLAPLNVSLYPTQLWASFSSILIFIFLLCIAKWAVKVPGALIFIYLLLACSVRFVVDFWRGDRELLGSISSMQLVVIPVFIFSLCVLIYLLFSSNKVRH